VGGFDNLAIIMVGLKFAPLIISSIKLVGALGSMATAMPMVAAGIKAIGLALTANPIGIIVMAIAGAAFLIYQYWEPIKGFFSGLWDGVKSIFSSAIEGVKTVLGWTPLGLIVNNWSGITDFIGGIWDNVINMTKKAVDWVSSKLEWVGKAADKVAGFFGFGGDDDQQSESEQVTTRSSMGRSPGAVIARAEAQQSSTIADPSREAASAQSTTNNRTSNQRAGDTFQISISQNAGEDPEDLARRVARIVQQQRRESESGALYDQPAGA